MNLQTESFYGARWMHKRRIKDLIANKHYLLKITDLNIIDNLIHKLDSISIQEIRLEKITHSDLDKYKQQVKIDATKNAKEKATLMTQALGQELGKAFQVIEIVPNKNIAPSYGYDFDKRKQFYEYENAEQLNYVSSNKLSKVNFKTITLTYNVLVKFELP